MENVFKPKSKLTYLLPLVAMLIDILVATATLKFFTEQVAGTIPNKISIPVIAFMLVFIDMTLGFSKEKPVIYGMGVIFIMIVPALTIAECVFELQNNLIMGETLGTDVMFANIGTVLKYSGLACFSYVSHYLLFKESKSIGVGWKIYDPTRISSENFDAVETELDENFDAEEMAHSIMEKMMNRKSRAEDVYA